MQWTGGYGARFLRVFAALSFSSFEGKSTLPPQLTLTVGYLPKFKEIKEADYVDKRSTKGSPFSVFWWLCRAIHCWNHLGVISRHQYLGPTSSRNGCSVFCEHVVVSVDPIDTKVNGASSKTQRRKHFESTCHTDCIHGSYWVCSCGCGHTLSRELVLPCQHGGSRCSLPALHLSVWHAAIRYFGWIINCRWYWAWSLWTRCI